MNCGKGVEQAQVSSTVGGEWKSAQAPGEAAQQRLLKMDIEQSALPLLYNPVEMQVCSPKTVQECLQGALLQKTQTETYPVANKQQSRRIIHGVIHSLINYSFINYSLIHE